MGLINKVVSYAINGHRREFEIAEEMYHEQRMKRDYYGTPKCPRGFGGSKEKCASLLRCGSCLRCLTNSLYSM